MQTSIIFQQLLFNPDYARRVLPFLNTDYFRDTPDKHLLSTILDYSNKYHSAILSPQLGCFSEVRLAYGLPVRSLWFRE